MLMMMILNLSSIPDLGKVYADVLAMQRSLDVCVLVILQTRELILAMLLIVVTVHQYSNPDDLPRPVINPVWKFAKHLMTLS